MKAYCTAALQTVAPSWCAMNFAETQAWHGSRRSMRPRGTYPPSSPCLLLSQSSAERRGAPASSASTAACISFCGCEQAGCSVLQHSQGLARAMLGCQPCVNHWQHLWCSPRLSAACRLRAATPAPPPTVLPSAGCRLSTTSRRRSQALADSAHCRPRRRTRLGRSCAWERTTGPCATPPPRLRGVGGQGPRGRAAGFRCMALCRGPWTGAYVPESSAMRQAFLL